MSLEIRGLAEHILADSGIRAPNSGVRGNLGVRDRPTRIQASGIRAPNSGVRGNLGVGDRPTRIPASGTLAPNSGVRGNLGVRDRPTRIQASGIRAPNSGVRGKIVKRMVLRCGSGVVSLYVLGLVAYHIPPLIHSLTSSSSSFSSLCSPNSLSLFSPPPSFRHLPHHQHRRLLRFS